MTGPSTRILVVDDYEPWRGYIVATLRSQSGFEIVGQASDGQQAVDQAQRLQPDLILLDIGLPILNGIEAARRIRLRVPQAKILFVSENRSWDFAEEALSTGASGYVIKSHAAGELLPAIEAVLRDRIFTSPGLCGADFNEPSRPQTGTPGTLGNAAISGARNKSGSHTVGFYSDDRSLPDGIVRYIEAALGNGSGAIVVATPAHRDCLLKGLQSNGVDIGQAIEQGRYLALDAAEVISTYVIRDKLDTARFLDGLGELVLKVSKAANGARGPVAIFGEAAHSMCVCGNLEAAIDDERVCNQLIKLYDVDILCGYALDKLPGGPRGDVVAQVCSEHSAVYQW